jgi:hypothetical protein
MRIKMPVLFWIRLDQICPKSIKLDQIGSIWIKKDQDGSASLFGSNQIKLVQIGLHAPTLTLSFFLSSLIIGKLGLSL